MFTFPFIAFHSIKIFLTCTYILVLFYFVVGFFFWSKGIICAVDYGPFFVFSLNSLILNTLLNIMFEVNSPNNQLPSE